ncbi:MAG: XRE family transcriptional regulator [Rubrivivax sp.]|nr:MAG: XRE family transcriptional regulator [Rubrivivax sp.]
MNAAKYSSRYRIRNLSSTLHWRSCVRCRALTSDIETRACRDELGWLRRRWAWNIGIDDSSSRARISRNESGVHEPPVQTAQAIARALKVPLAYLYCKYDSMANLLAALNELPEPQRAVVAEKFSRMLGERD